MQLPHILNLPYLWTHSLSTHCLPYICYACMAFWQFSVTQIRPYPLVLPVPPVVLCVHTHARLHIDNIQVEWWLHKETVLLRNDLWIRSATFLDSSPRLLVTLVQLMRPDIGWNVSLGLPSSPGLLIVDEWGYSRYGVHVWVCMWLE